ncbi:hypothetical protein MF271_00670 (plasmid) [Deinococcus sp. KNUC1210]|uniref:hypothetical protein n=1 Tax=Deinococcus sp. KNUC1210 TaxID=2917691 RepID=UPI001EEFBCC2|nr:hypothetical protein [Deinococcus sp. KNUC1210]ULH14026.1 hypothetical protein MF271_00670 [Deinococcus sp. KNUC1210]
MTRPYPEYGNIADIFKVLQRFTDAFDSETPQDAASQRRYTAFTRWSLVLLAMAAIFAIYGAFHPSFNWKWVYYWCLGTSVTISLAANIQVYREQPDVLSRLSKPKPAILKRLAEVIALEEQYARELHQYTPATVKYARARLAVSLENQKDRAEALFGLATKVGLFPSILSAGLAFLVAIRTAPVSIILLSLALTALLFFNHTVAHNIQINLIDMRAMLALLDRTIQEQDIT